MNQIVPQHLIIGIDSADSSQDPSTDTTICHVTNSADAHDLVFTTAPDGITGLVKLGFTHLELDSEMADQLSDLHGQGLKLLTTLPHPNELIYIEDWGEAPHLSAAKIWNQLADTSGFTRVAPGNEVTTSQHAVALMLQMAIPYIPIVELDSRLIPSRPDYRTQSGREYRELLRSLTFWRHRFSIHGYSPKLVHAGQDGLLIFTVDSWLVVLNQNSDDADIDLGSHGSFWLMLGTARDVHLHGSVLGLPAHSGAILANDLVKT